MGPIQFSSVCTNAIRERIASHQNENGRSEKVDQTLTLGIDAWRPSLRTAVARIDVALTCTPYRLEKLSIL